MTLSIMPYYYTFDAVAGKNGEIFIGYECTYTYKGEVGVFVYTPYVADYFVQANMRSDRIE